MPVDLGYFIIKKPRVSPINAVDTKPPTSQGTLATYPALSITYMGSASSAIFNLTGSKFITLIDETPAHADNLNLDILGNSIGDLVTQLSAKTNYSCSLITPNSSDLCLFQGANRQDILGVPYTVLYNKELEYLVDTETEGKLGSCSIDTKVGAFTYRGMNSRWMMDEGSIYDSKNISVPLSGVTDVGSDGVQIVYYPSASVDKNDINKTVAFTNLELTASLSYVTDHIVFQGAPILVDGTLELKINQVIKTENLDYKVNYGVLPEIIGQNAGPYVISSSQNVFKIRYDSDDVQEFIIPEGSYTVSELAQIINPLAQNFQVMEYRDDTTKLTYFTVQAFRGTYYHQLRVEDGSINSVLGFTDFVSKKGDGVGTINYLTHVIDEVLVPTDKINSFIVAGTQAVTGNPFIGVNTANFKLYENNTLKRKDVDFFVDTYGTVIFSDIILGEKLTGGILTKDTQLFKEDYVLYSDDKKLVPDVDYVITPERGWISLTTSAFPGTVYTADYKHESFGDITGEILLGARAMVLGIKRGPYFFDNSNNNLIFEVNGIEANITLPLGMIKVTEVVSSINLSGSGYVASVMNNFLAISTFLAGGNKSIKIKPCSANIVLGFLPNQSARGKGAEGGEQSLDVPNVPMILSGFVAPAGGDTIIIKNNDVRARYPSGAILNINSDYYEVSSSYLVNEANIIGSVSEPYTILAGSNDIFTFNLDGVDYTLTFQAGFKIGIIDMVNQINAVKTGAAEVVLLNGSKKVKLRATNKVIIGNGTSNRSLGFYYKSEDTNSPDTYIQTTSTFKNTYIAPPMYTTIEPVIFNVDLTEKLQTPKNSNSVVFLGNQISNYKAKTLLKFKSIYFYEVMNSSYDEVLDRTTVTFLSPLELAVDKDTLTEYTVEPVVSEGTLTFNSKFYPNLNQPYTLRKNNVLLAVDIDYTIGTSGDIELKVGLINGDNLILNYVSKRFVNAGTLIRTDYTYFDYLKKGSNIKISFTGLNPDNFYIKVQHGTNLMKSYQKELADHNSQAANSSSSGFPTGEIPTQDNTSSGNDSYPYRLGVIDEKIELATKWYSYFDTRLFYFEKERELLSGYLVGAENGRVTTSDIENAVNTPPTRLFPLPDNRPEEQKADPVRLPALDGLNQNDLGSATLGWVSPTITATLSTEQSDVSSERSKLVSLLGMSITNGSLMSSGDLDIPFGGETMTLYVEIKSGLSFTQHTIIATFDEGTTPPVIFPPTPGGHSVQTPSYIADQINIACSGLGVAPASVSGPNVVLNTTSANAVCIYIVSDAPNVGFGTGNCSAVRSRHTLWTGGYSSSYAMPVPGLSSVHIDIVDANSARASSATLHNSQISQVQGEMDEWIAPFDLSFPNSKLERGYINTWLSTLDITTTNSNLFDDLKNMAQSPLTAIDDNAVINSRIADLDFRANNEIIPRSSRVSSRLTEIQNTLTTEALYDPRFMWLSVLTNKSNGLYTTRKIEIESEARKQREAVRNGQTLESINKFS